MQKYADKNGNTIYAHRHPAEMNIYIEFRGSKGSTIYLAQEVESRGCSRIAVNGDNVTVFIGRAQLGELTMIMGNNAVCYIGNDTNMHPYVRAQRFDIASNTSIVIGDDCMISENIEIPTSDWHPIYDANSGRRGNAPCSVFIGDHVWLGRNVSIFKGSRLASGSILGFGSILTGKYCPPNSTNAGVPAKMLGTGKFWGRIASGEVATEQERCLGMFKYDANIVIRPCDIEYTLKSLATSQEKIEFLYDVLYLNSRHNRFAWNEESAVANDGVLLTYTNSFERHVSGISIVKEKWNSPILNVPWAVLNDNVTSGLQLQALWLKRYSIRWQYWRCKVMRCISWGRKRRKYKEKSVRYMHFLRQIQSYEKMMKHPYGECFL